nr:MAG TPA: hypothetical protein [Caudoviricetes sp.]
MDSYNYLQLLIHNVYVLLVFRLLADIDIYLHH